MNCMLKDDLLNDLRHMPLDSNVHSSVPDLHHDSAIAVNSVDDRDDLHL